GSARGTRTSPAAKRCCAASVHSVWPNDVYGGRTTTVSTFVSVSPAAARTPSTAAAATSGGPRLSHSALAESLSDSVIAFSTSVSRPSARAAIASGTLIVDQAAPLVRVPAGVTAPPAEKTAPLLPPSS